jgi:hypothetical protein
VVRGRVIRYEEGKEAEIFTLVIAETVEENWYNNSTAGKAYTEITEEELDEILNINQNVGIQKEGKDVNELFRL